MIEIRGGVINSYSTFRNNSEKKSCPGDGVYGIKFDCWYYYSEWKKCFLKTKQIKVTWAYGISCPLDEGIRKTSQVFLQFGSRNYINKTLKVEGIGMVNGQGEMKDYVNKKYYINVFASVDINLAKID